MKLKSIPILERPRERLINYGPENISNEDLLAIILKTGTKDKSVKDLSLEVLSKISSIKELSMININTFNDIKGLGMVKTIELIAAIELGKRIFLKNESNLVNYSNPDNIYKDNKYMFIGKKQEYFYALYLDNHNNLIKKKLLFIGTVNQSIVHPREIFKEAYLSSSSKIICLHNHPSGNITPSKEDKMLTDNLVRIGHIHGIPVIDHIIIGKNEYYSFFEHDNI